MNPEDLFAQRVIAILDRFSLQNSRPAPPRDEADSIARQLWRLIEERGLPRPLATTERGEPGELPDEEVTPMVERVLRDVAVASRETLAGPVRQLVKACFYPEFKTCRDSFREVSPDGKCRRQELARTRGRISGAHCLDCPHWVALTPEQHGKFLAKEWRSGADEFLAHRGIFLPEDFRALKVFLHQQARIGI